MVVVVMMMQRQRAWRKGRREGRIDAPGHGRGHLVLSRGSWEDPDTRRRPRRQPSLPGEGRKVF